MRDGASTHPEESRRFKSASLRRRVFSFRDSLLLCVKDAHLAGIRHPRSTGEPVSSGPNASFEDSSLFALWAVMQGEGFGSVRECERYRQQVVDDTVYERDHNEELSAPYDYKIKLFANAECVSVQDPRLRQRR
jgi:hypothetical protein